MNKHNNIKTTNFISRKSKIVIIFFCLFILSTLLTACGSDGGSSVGTVAGGTVGEGTVGEETGDMGEGVVYSTAVTLTWDASPTENIAGYNVYYNSGEATFPLGVFGANEGTSPIDIGNTTTATITGLMSSELHYFTVTTYDYAGNESTFSNIASTYPAAQQNL